MVEESSAVPAASFKKAEERVEAHSAVFKKELGLLDVALIQILFLLSTTWIGTAAKIGPAHILFWLPAIALFFIPSAVVVVQLNRLMPLEGGLYQWSKLGFNEFTGFMVGWNYYLSNIVFMATIGLDAATLLSYVFGPSAGWMTDSKWFINLLGLLIVSLLVIIAIFGLGIGKWLYNVGGVVRFAVFGALAALPFIGLARGSLREFHPLATTMPALSLFSLNILGKMAFGAFSGFDGVPIFAGECRNPRRTIARSVIISTPIIAVLYLLTTSSVLAFVRPEEIDLIATPQQVLGIGLRPFGLDIYVVPVVSLAGFVLLIAVNSILFAQNARLPMVTGWDHLLPEWFTRLHARYKTPINSIAFGGVLVIILGLLSLIGAGYQEAFQMLLNASFILWALTYLVMFAIPVLGLRGVTPRPPAWLKVVSISGFLMTLLYTVLSIFPIIEVQSIFAFAAKIIGVIITVNAMGLAIFLVAERRRRNKEQSVELESGKDLV
jgi:amino acid transporter